VLASILKAKGIPTRFVGSFDHLWVDYPGKHANAIENAATAVATQQADGRYQFKWPKLVEWQKSWEIERAYFWDMMPGWRLMVLLGGWVLLALCRSFWRQPSLIICSRLGPAISIYDGDERLVVSGPGAASSTRPGVTPE